MSKVVQGIYKAYKDVEKNMRFATAVALTKTAKNAQGELKIELERVFDRPTPFIKKSFYIKPATKQKLVSRVGIKDFAGKGTPAVDILSPHIEGGRRLVKRFEQRLREKRILGQDEYVVPGVGIRLNRYGNVTGAQITQTLSVLGAHTEVGFMMNVTDASRRRNKKLPELFVIRSSSKSHLHPGIYKRFGKKKIKPIFIFVKNVDYRKRLKFFETIKDTYDKKFQPNLNEAVAKYV